MTDERYELSRRNALAALGAIGVASAGAGLGTSAYFSDEETFKNNTLTAGSLDLKVDWEEHYSNWSDDEMVMISDGNDGTMAGIKMQEPSDTANWNAMPDTEHPMLWVHDDAVEDFMKATAIEAYPDDGDNGEQSLHRYAEENYCDILADTPEDLDPNRSDPARTLNDDTVDENGNPKPLISLEDVKPGDFGELTLSYHLCDNPGYVWLTGNLVSAHENGVTEPEQKDPDEDYPEGDTVELLDTVQTMLWYDEDGDNVYEPGGTGGPVDVVLALDSSGSMMEGELDDDDKIAEAADAARTLVSQLEGGPHQVGIVDWDNGGSPPATKLQDLTGNFSDVYDAIDDYETNAGGRTNLEGGSVWGIEELLDDEDFHPEATNPSGNARDNADKILVLMSDGEANEALANTTGPGNSSVGDLNGDGSAADAGDQAIGVCNAAKNEDVRIFSIGLETSGDAEDTLEACASPGDFYSGVPGEELADVFSQIGQVLTGEECFFRGSLRQLLNLIAGNDLDGNEVGAPGIPLDGDRSSQFEEVVENANPWRPADGANPNRDPFVSSTQNYIGFAWWLPIDHGNEVQTDSVAFDLGFYTEQARHNDGSGMSSLVPTRRGSGWAKMEENFNGNETESSFARARFGDNIGDSGAWEAAVGNEPGDATEGNYKWTPGETVDWTYTYSANDDRARFILDGDVDIEYTGLAEQPDGRVAIQTKADEATISVEDVAMVVDGEEVALSGPVSVEASNDDAEGEDGRDLQYLVINSTLDGESNFTVEGSVTVELQEDFDGGEEDVAMDVVLE